MDKLPLGNFERFKGTRYERFILPILPKAAVLKPRADGTTLDESNKGKIPGKFFPHLGQWIGFPEWTTHVTTRFHLEDWQKWHRPEMQVPPCMRCAEHPMIDLDINGRQDIVDRIRALALRELGPHPIRARGNSTRVTLVFRWESGTTPATKWSRAFDDEHGVEHKFECLGKGQQSVIEGPHASGAMHTWPYGDLLDWEDKLTAVDGDKLWIFKNKVEELLKEDFGYEVKKGSLSQGHDSTVDAIEIGHPVLRSPLAIKANDEAAKQLLATAINAIDLNHDSLADYNCFIGLLHAVKAACDGEHQFFLDVVWPWLAKHPENAAHGIEWAEEKWNSIKRSINGYELVYDWAAKFKCTAVVEAVTAARSDQAQELFANDDTTPTTSPEVSGGDSTLLPPGDSGSGSGGAGGPTPFNDTHFAVADAFQQQYGDRWRYNIDAKRWFFDEAGIWRPDESITEVIGTITRALSRQVLATVNGPIGANRSRALESTGTVMAIRNLLQGRSGMMVREADFDSQPHLLNTPDFVVDLRTGEMMPHSPELLMRMMTRCSPDIMAIGDYEKRCPRFFAILHNIAAGRAWVILAIRAWLAYTLTGDMRHQALMFLYGPPGVGKSQLVQVFFDLMHMYSLLIDESFLSKNGGEAKRFDMADLIGKRFGFMDETQLGMSWDETRMSKVAGGRELSAELKFGRRVPFQNTAKITIVGNHQPNFTAAETGGLVSRMMLVEAGGVSYRNGAGEISDLAALIVEQEGPAVMMWALEACVADYCTDGLFTELTREAKAASAEYAKEDSLLYQWVKDDMRLADDANIDVIDAQELFLEYAKRTMPASRIPQFKRGGFKKALKAAFPALVFGGVRSVRPHPNREYIKGLGRPEVDLSALGDTVVPFPTPTAAKER